MFKKLRAKYTIHKLARRVQNTLATIVSLRQTNKLSKKDYDHYLHNLMNGITGSKNKGFIKICNLLNKLLDNPSCMTPKQAGKLISKYTKTLPFDDSITSAMKLTDRRTKLSSEIRLTVVHTLHDKQSGKIPTRVYNHLMSSLSKNIPMHQFTNLDSVHKLIVKLNNNSTCMTPKQVNLRLKSLLDNSSKWKVVDSSAFK